MIVCFLVIPLISAETLGAVKKGDCISIIQTCDNCTYVNITRVTINNQNLSYPNLMMSQPVQGNYNYSYCNNSVLGNYIITTCGDLNGNYQCESFDYKVTNSGYIQTVPESLGLLGYLMVYIFLTMFLVVLGVYLTNSDYLWILGIFFIFLSLLLLIYDSWLGYEFYTSYSNSVNSGMPEIIFYSTLFIIVAGFWGAVVMVIANWNKLMKRIKNEIRNKEEEEVDKDFDDIFKY